MTRPAIINFGRRGDVVAQLSLRFKGAQIRKRDIYLAVEMFPFITGHFITGDDAAAACVVTDYTGGIASIGAVFHRVFVASGAGNG